MQSLDLLANLIPQIAAITAGDNSIPNPTIFRRNFKKGGVVSGGNVNAEGKEVVKVPGAEAVELEGASHKEGGIDLDVPPGTVIYSDKVKGPDGRSMAERKLSRDRLLQKFSSALKENKADAIHKATAVRGMETLVMQELTDIAIMQKEFMDTQQKGKKVKAETGYVVPPNYAQTSPFYGETPAKPRKVSKGYKWDEPFDPYYFQKAYFAKEQKQWDNWVGKTTVGAMGTPEGQAIMENLRMEYNKENTPQAGTPPNPEGIQIPSGRNNILQDQFNAQAQLDAQTANPYEVNTDNAKIIPQAPGTYSPIDAPGYDFSTPEPDYTYDPQTGPSVAVGGEMSGDEVTAGDLASVAAPIGKTAVTLLNRLGDRPTPNYARGIGDEEVALAGKAIQGAAEGRDMDMQRNNALLNTLRMNRGGRSINASRAFDIGTLTEAQKNAGRISSTFNSVLRDLVAKQGALSTRRDQVQAEGRKFADITDEQNRDAFATNIGVNIGDVAAGFQHKERNQLRRKLGITNEASGGAEQLMQILSQFS